MTATNVSAGFAGDQPKKQMTNAITFLRIICFSVLGDSTKMFDRKEYMLCAVEGSYFCSPFLSWR
jgi:hypothetical protein